MSWVMLLVKENGQTLVYKLFVCVYVCVHYRISDHFTAKVVPVSGALFGHAYEVANKFLLFTCFCRVTQIVRASVITWFCFYERFDRSLGQVHRWVQEMFEFMFRFFFFNLRGVSETQLELLFDTAIERVHLYNTVDSRIPFQNRRKIVNSVIPCMNLIAHISLKMEIKWLYRFTFYL